MTFKNCRRLQWRVTERSTIHTDLSIGANNSWSKPPVSTYRILLIKGPLIPSAPWSHRGPCGGEREGRHELGHWAHAWCFPPMALCMLPAQRQHLERGRTSGCHHGMALWQHTGGDGGGVCVWGGVAQCVSVCVLQRARGRGWAYDGSGDVALCMCVCVWRGRERERERDISTISTVSAALHPKSWHMIVMRLRNMHNWSSSTEALAFILTSVTRGEERPTLGGICLLFWSNQKWFFLFIPSPHPFLFVVQWHLTFIYMDVFKFTIPHSAHLG